MLTKMKNLCVMVYYFIRVFSFYFPALWRAKWSVRQGNLEKAKEILYRDTSKKLFRLFDIRLDIQGDRTIQPVGSRPIIYVSNHPSMLDIPSLLQIINIDTRMIYSYEVAEFPFPGFRWILDTFAHLPISTKRDKQLDIDKARINDAMTQGGYYWAAPEGGLQSKGLAPFKKSIFHMAKDHDALVVPICIQGSGQIIAQAKDWLSVKVYHGRTITCTILPTLDAKDFADVEGLWKASFESIECKIHSSRAL